MKRIVECDPVFEIIAFEHAFARSRSPHPFGSHYRPKLPQRFEWEVQTFGRVSLWLVVPQICWPVLGKHGAGRKCDHNVEPLLIRHGRIVEFSAVRRGGDIVPFGDPCRKGFRVLCRKQCIA